MLKRNSTNLSSKHSYYNAGSPTRNHPGPRRSPSNIRILRTHLVYVIGLESELCSEAILSSPEYFGKYGNVLKVAVNKRANMSRRQASYSAVVTYEDQISASLALVSLFEFKYSSSIMRCCYGCSKYCDNFFYGRECRKLSCLYMHQFDSGKEIHLDSTEKDQDYDFDRHYKMATDIVYESLGDIARDYRHLKKQRDIFPNPYQTLRVLVDDNYLSQSEYQREWEEDEPAKCYTQSTQPLKEGSEPQSQLESEDQPVSQEQPMSVDPQQQIYKMITLKINRKINEGKLNSRLEFAQKLPGSPRFIQRFKSFFSQGKTLRG